MSLESSPKSPSQANAEASGSAQQQTPNMRSTKLVAAQKSRATTPIDDDRFDVSMSSQSQNEVAPSSDERLDLSVGAEFLPESSAHGTKSKISLTTGELAAKKTRTHLVSSTGDKLTKLPSGSSIPSQHRQSDATAGAGTAYQSSNSALTAVQPRQMVNVGTASAGTEISIPSEHGSELWKIVVCMVYGMDFPQIIHVYGADTSFSFFVMSFDLLAIAWTLSGHSATFAQTKRELERLAHVEHSTLLVDPDERQGGALKLNRKNAELQAYCRNAPNLHVNTHVALVRSLYTFDNPLVNTLNLEKGDFEARALLELITYFCKQTKFQHIAKYHLGTDKFRVVDLGRIRIALACRLGYTTGDTYPTKKMSNWGYIEEGGQRSGHIFNLKKDVVGEMVNRKIGDYTLTFSEAFRRKLELLRTDEFEVNTGREITSSTQVGSNTAAFTGVQPGNNPTNTRPMTSRLAVEHVSQATGSERQSRHALPKLSTSTSVPEGKIADSKRKSSADPEHHIAKQARSSQNVPTSDEGGSTTTSQQTPFGQQPFPIDDITRSDSPASPHRQSRSHVTDDASGDSKGMRRNPSEDTEKAPND